MNDRNNNGDHLYSGEDLTPEEVNDIADGPYKWEDNARKEPYIITIKGRSSISVKNIPDTRSKFKKFIHWIIRKEYTPKCKISIEIYHKQMGGIEIPMNLNEVWRTESGDNYLVVDKSAFVIRLDIIGYKSPLSAFDVGSTLIFISSGL